jgi:hypothetical protein
VDGNEGGIHSGGWSEVADLQSRSFRLLTLSSGLRRI